MPAIQKFFVEFMLLILWYYC